MSIVIPADVRGRTALNFHVTNSPSPDFLPDHYFFGFLLQDRHNSSSTSRAGGIIALPLCWFSRGCLPNTSTVAARPACKTTLRIAAVHSMSIVASNVFEFDQKNVRRVDIGRDAFSSPKFRPHRRITKRGRNRRQRASKLLARIRRSCSLYSTTPSAVGASPRPDPRAPSGSQSPQST
jgi:hypothetical protein